MATIKLSDRFGVNFDVALAEHSALLNYLSQVRDVVLKQTDLSKIGGLTLDQPAVRTMDAGFAFKQTIGVGASQPALEIGAHGGFAVIVREPGAERLFAGDRLADGIDLPEGACFVRTGIESSAAAAIAGGSGGPASFGADPGSGIEFANYRRYSLREGVTVLDALREGIGSFIIPTGIEDLEAMPVHGVASAKLTGSLKLSATAELLAQTNPLASAALPGALPAVSLRAGGSVRVGASWAIDGKYEVRAHKLANERLQVGWYRETSSELRVRASASGGIAARIGDTDLLSTLLHAISTDPAADRDALEGAGLTDDQRERIEAAVQAAVNRNLELAVSSEIGFLRSGEAAFLYELDLPSVTPESRRAIEQALRGDLTALHAAQLPGVSCLRSISTELQARSITWNVNLLGIYNLTSVAKLISKGAVLYEPATGALVISDQVTYSKIRSAHVNLGADTQKLRRVLAESFLITAAYRGAAGVVSGPSLHCGHTFFELRNGASRDDMLRYIRAAVALGLVSDGEVDLPAGVDGFGRTTVLLQTQYDDRLTAGLFLRPDGKPFPREIYEAVGRSAILSLVAHTDLDAARRLPAIEDDLWVAMKERGQPNFKTLFPAVPAPVLGAISADYTTIVWWAEAMAGTGERLAKIRQWLENNPGVSGDDPAFQKLRRKLADYLEKVAARTTEEFGQPWGLIAMHEMSQRRAAASVLISSPAFVRRQTRALAGTAASPDI